MKPSLIEFERQSMTSQLLLIGMCVLASAGSAFSQGLSVKSAELSLSVGGTTYSKKSFTIGAPQSSTPINGVMQLDSGKTYEARINFYNSNRLGSEFLYGYQYSGVSLTRDSPTQGSFSVPLQIHTLTLNILYYPLGEASSSWRPFLTVGGGAVIYRPSTGGQASAKDPLQGNFDTFFESNRGSGTVGGGVKHPITRTLGFRADASVVFTKVPTFGLPQSSTQSNAIVLPVSGLTQSVRASAGLIIYLGK
jgi:hypothetical protein